MGFFGSKDKTADYDAVQPGAIPVATPVPEVRAYQNQQAAAMAKYSGTVATNVPSPPQQQHSQHQNQQHSSSSSPSSPSSPYHSSHDPTMARVPMLMGHCPNCRQESRTRITTYPTWQTWTASGVMLLVFWPICWVPLILDNCKQTDHYCVLCQAKVGKVNAFQDCCVTEQS